MRYYCTYFDHNYLPRGLALYKSLEKKSGPFKLYVLCLSEICFTTLTRLNLPFLVPIQLEQFELGDNALAVAKSNRSVIEYYFTCTPSLLLYIFKINPDIDLLTYLDGDLFFFDDPEKPFDEMGTASIAITPHRFPPALKDHEKYGLFNVGWLAFRKDSAGMACLQWWRDRCNEWCYDKLEDDRYADQKYLDRWPNIFKNLKVIHHPGINLGPWNVSGEKLEALNDHILVSGQPLIVFHFHALKQLSPGVYDPQWSKYKVMEKSILKEKVYLPYLQELASAIKLAGLEKSVRDFRALRSAPSKQSLLSPLKLKWKIFRGVLTGKYLRVQ